MPKRPRDNSGHENGLTVPPLAEGELSQILLEIAKEHGGSTPSTIRRRHAAALCSISVSTFRRKYETTLTVERDDRGVVHFSLSDVVQLACQLRANQLGEAATTEAEKTVEANASPPVPVDKLVVENGDLCSRAFELFKAGNNIVDATLVLRQPVEAVKVAFEHYASALNLLVIDGLALNRILSKLGFQEVENQEQFFTFVVSAYEQGVICHNCESEAAVFCKCCAREWGAKEANRIRMNRRQSLDED